jgi:hypothetical protein
LPTTWGHFRGTALMRRVTWNGGGSGTWYATISASPCNPWTECPLSIDQVRLLKQRALDAKLYKAAALCSKIAGDDNSLAKAEAGNSQNSSGSVQTPGSGVCFSKRIKTVMQTIEDQQMRDPNGAMLQALACGITGVCANSGAAHIIDSAEGSDGGRYTSKDPGSFVCRGLFLRGKVNMEVVQNDDDPAPQLTKETMESLLEQYPHFIEWFKVKRLQNGHYLLSLIPTSIQLSREYSQEFVYL